MEEDSIENNKTEPCIDVCSDAVPLEKGDALTTLPLGDEEMDRKPNESKQAGNNHSTNQNEENKTKNVVDSTSQESESSSKSQTPNEEDPEMRPSSTKDKNKDRKKFGVLLPILTISFVVFLTVLVIYFIDAPDKKGGENGSETIKTISGRQFRVRVQNGGFEMKRNVTETELELDMLKGNIDCFFLIVMGCIVFLMQCGFAFLEAGSVRSKNTVNILIKNMVDVLIGGVSYWAIGWGLSFGRGTSGILGMGEFFSYGIDPNIYPLWFFQFVFAATASTIVSGALAERVEFSAYFLYSLILTAVVYPLTVHWCWASGDLGCYTKPDDPSTLEWVECEEGKTTEIVKGKDILGCYNCTSHGAGWLVNLGYNDFAGSGIVHLLGGLCALVGCYFIGPREGRFTEDGPKKISGHSVPFAALGGFILLFGFLAFNGGSQLQISAEGDAAAVGTAVVNTIIGGCGGGLTVLFSFKWRSFRGRGNSRKWSFLLTLNGALTGMVSLCAGCDEYHPWGALIVGSIGGLMFIAVHIAMKKCKLDDPLDAVAVHAGGGFIGVIMVPFFSMADGGEAGEDQGGIFVYGDHSYAWKRLGINLLGVLAIALWSILWSVIIFGGLKKLKLLRIDHETERLGNDGVKHGESAYPMDAWVLAQVKDSL